MQRFSFLTRRVSATTRAANLAVTLVPFLSTTHRLLTTEGIDRAAKARSAISGLWSRHGNDPISPFSSSSTIVGSQNLDSEAKVAEARIAECSAAARALMDEYKLTPQVPRDEDVTHALGDSFERLILLLVPLEPENVPYIERCLLMAARAQYEISIRTIQHLFSRTRTYAEALTLFHLLRQCHVKMNMHSYYAMVFCLQRLEEESWALRFREETLERAAELKKKMSSSGSDSDKKQLHLTPEEAAAPSVQALEFVLHGCDNQLLPESKPWLGRVMMADQPDMASAAALNKSADHFDQFSTEWSKRFRGEEQQP